MTTQDIIDYVMHTPGNTNPVILKQLIEENGQNSSSVDKDLEIFLINETVDFGSEDMGPTYTLDKTWQEIYDVYNNNNGYNKVAIIKKSNTIYPTFNPVTSCDDIYYNIYTAYNGLTMYQATTPNDYPSYYDNGK